MSFFVRGDPRRILEASLVGVTALVDRARWIISSLMDGQAPSFLRICSEAVRCREILSESC